MNTVAQAKRYEEAGELATAARANTKTTDKSSKDEAVEPETKKEVNEAKSKKGASK